MKYERSLVKFSHSFAVIKNKRGSHFFFRCFFRFSIYSKYKIDEPCANWWNPSTSRALDILLKQINENWNNCQTTYVDDVHTKAEIKPILMIAGALVPANIDNFHIKKRCISFNGKHFALTKPWSMRWRTAKKHTYKQKKWKYFCVNFISSKNDSFGNHRTVCWMTIITHSILKKIESSSSL